VEFFDKEFYACTAPVAYSCGLWSLPLFCFHESHLVFCNIVPRHTYDDCSVLDSKPGMTRTNGLVPVSKY
jgi:hypothetical protein